MALLDFLKTQPNEQGQSQWDWGGKILPGLAAIAGASGSMLNGIQQGNEAAMNRRRQSNLDAWNKMIQDEQMKKLQRENATVDITPTMGEQFKGTKYEPFVWNPGETKTQSTTDYLSNVGIANPGGVNLTGQVTTEKPESLKETSMNRNEYLGMVNDVEAQKAAKNATDLKALMERQKSDTQTTKDAEDKRRWEAEQKLDWYNATKDKSNKSKEPTPEQRKYMESIASTAGQYRSQNDYLADLSRNRDKVIQQIGVDGYQRLVKDATDNVGTIWNVNKGVKDTKGNTILVGGQYKQGQGSPMAPLFGGSPRTLISGKSSNQQSSHGKVVKTGMYNGKKVIQYEDGTIEYDKS